jgi:PqqD family protein of HPr-rel-A system
VTAVWRICADGALSWRCWDGDYVVYNVVTGDTHALEALAAEVFDALLAEPGDLTALEHRVAAELSVESGPEFSAQIGSIVDRLQAFALIEMVPERRRPGMA